VSLPVVAFPDVEAALVGYLDGVLDAGVHSEWPAKPLENNLPFVAVSRGGGAVVTRFVLEDVTVDFDVLAASKAEAHDLAQLVRAHVFAAEGTAQGGARIYRVDDVSLIWLPYVPAEGVAPTARYVLVMTLRVRPA
jgi:hypothetical protein